MRKKSKTKLVLFVILMFLLTILILTNQNLYSQSNFPELKKFTFENLEFYMFNIAKDSTIDLSKYIIVSDSIFSSKYINNHTRYHNEQVLWSTDCHEKYLIKELFKTKCLISLSESNDSNGSYEYSIDAYSLKNLRLLYHNVVIYDEKKELNLIQVIEYDYESKIYYKKDIFFSNSSQNKEIKRSFKEAKKEELDKANLVIEDSKIELMQFFDIYNIVKDQLKILIKIPYTYSYIPIKSSNSKESKYNVGNKEYNCMIYKFLGEYSFFQNIFSKINDEKNNIELFISKGEIPIVLKYIFKYELDNDFFIDIYEVKNIEKLGN